MQILIVEEEPSVANAMTFALESRGHTVAVACRAQDALNMPRPEVLIADPERGVFSGLDLLEQYGHGAVSPRTIFISATPSLDSCRRALRLGASEFLSKPFHFEELFEAVETQPTQPETLLDLTYVVSKNGVEVCMRDLAAFALRCGVGPTCRARACSAIGEVIENVRLHAYADQSGPLRMTASFDERDLVVTISDDGIGLDSDLIVTDVMSVGGGLARASALSESIDLRAEPGVGTTVKLRFGAYTVDFAGNESADLTELDFLTPEMTGQILSTLELEGAESFFQLTPSLAVVIGRLLAGPDPERLAAQVLRS